MADKLSERARAARGPHTVARAFAVPRSAFVWTLVARLVSSLWCLDVTRVKVSYWMKGEMKGIKFRFTDFGKLSHSLKTTHLHTSKLNSV